MKTVLFAISVIGLPFVKAEFIIVKSTHQVPLGVSKKLYECRAPSLSFASNTKALIFQPFVFETSFTTTFAHIEKSQQIPCQSDFLKCSKLKCNSKVKEKIKQNGKVKNKTKNMLLAFFFGGLIGLLAQAFYELYMKVFYLDMAKK